MGLHKKEYTPLIGNIHCWWGRDVKKQYKKTMSSVFDTLIDQIAIYNDSNDDRINIDDFMRYAIEKISFNHNKQELDEDMKIVPVTYKEALEYEYVYNKQSGEARNIIKSTLRNKTRLERLKDMNEMLTDEKIPEIF